MHAFLREKAREVRDTFFTCYHTVVEEQFMM